MKYVENKDRPGFKEANEDFGKKLKELAEAANKVLLIIKDDPKLHIKDIEAMTSGIGVLLKFRILKLNEDNPKACNCCLSYVEEHGSRAGQSAMLDDVITSRGGGTK